MAGAGVRHPRRQILPDRAAGSGDSDLRLQKLTGLEHEKLLDEYKELLNFIAELIFILESPERLMEVIREELVAVKELYNDGRRTEITANTSDINIEDLINQKTWW